MVLTTPIVLTYTHVIELVFLNHTHTRGPSVACKRNVFIVYFYLQTLFFFKSLLPTDLKLDIQFSSVNIYKAWNKAWHRFGSFAQTWVLSFQPSSSQAYAQIFRNFYLSSDLASNVNQCFQFIANISYLLMSDQNCIWHKSLRVGEI